jgi:hypothetical protein
MPLTKLVFKPGIDRSSTNYSREGGYYACDKVRFRYGFPEKIGGWIKYTQNTFSGTARALFNWVTVDNRNLLAVGTNTHYYVERSGTFHDITPIRLKTTLPDASLATTEGSTTLRVTQANHGAVSGDKVVISGAVDVGGIPDEAINGTFTVIVIDVNTFTIGTGVPATSTTTGGGAAVVTEFPLSASVDQAMKGLGWGAGRWSRKAWSTPADSNVTERLRLWSQDAFGEDLVFCTRGGKIYFWDYSEGFGKRAVALTDMPGANEVPVIATCVLTSTQDRHFIAFGTNPISSLAQDPLLIRWSNQEDITEWFPDITNTAGEIRLSSGNQIVTAVRLNQEILVFTDGTIHSMQMIGAPYIFGSFPVADNISIISANAVAVVGNTVVWMGKDKFYTYSGQATTVPCPLLDYIFDDINLKQADKFFAGTNEGFSEVWWFYCSKNSSEVDRYVIFNYDEETWAYGTMQRSAWLDSPMKESPIAAGGQHIYYHEQGTDDDRTAPIHAWVETADFDVEEGERFAFVKKFYPDVTFTGSNAITPKVTFTLTPRNTPGASYKAGDAVPTARSSVTEIEQFTEWKSVRLRGRQMKMRLESNELGVHWRLGAPRIEIITDGQK